MSDELKIAEGRYIRKSDTGLELRQERGGLGDFVNLSVKYPSTNNHSATKSYVDAALRGVANALTCAQASTTNIDIGNLAEGGDDLDGIVLRMGEYVIIKDQDDPSENGIYQINSNNAPSRVLDTILTKLNLFYVERGIVNGEKFFQVSGDYSSIPDYNISNITFTFYNTNGAIPPGTGATTLVSLTDVNIPSISIGDVLQYNGTSWVNTPSSQETEFTVITTNATPTNIITQPISPNGILQLEVRIAAYRTGGSAGANGDCASITKTITARRIGSGAVEVLGVQSDYTHKDQDLWNISFVGSAASLSVKVIGAINNVVSWHAKIKTISSYN